MERKKKAQPENQEAEKQASKIVRKWMCQTPETDGGSATEVVEEKPGGIGGFLKGIFGGRKKEESSESTPAPSGEPGSGETGIENSQEVDVPRDPGNRRR